VRASAKALCAPSASPARSRARPSVSPTGQYKWRLAIAEGLFFLRSLAKSFLASGKSFFAASKEARSSSDMMERLRAEAEPWRRALMAAVTGAFFLSTWLLICLLACGVRVAYCLRLAPEGGVELRRTGFSCCEIAVLHGLHAASEVLQLSSEEEKIFKFRIGLAGGEQRLTSCQLPVRRAIAEKC